MNGQPSIKEEADGIWVASIPAPSLSTLLEVAAAMPPGARCVDLETDWDGAVYGVWEVH